MVKYSFYEPSPVASKEVDESIEVEVEPITTTACASPSVESNYDDCITASKSEARSDINATESTSDDGRDGDNYVLILSEQEEDLLLHSKSEIDILKEEDRPWVSCDEENIIADNNPPEDDSCEPLSDSNPVDGSLSSSKSKSSDDLPSLITKNLVLPETPRKRFANKAKMAEGYFVKGPIARGLDENNDMLEDKAAAKKSMSTYEKMAAEIALLNGLLEASKANNDEPMAAIENLEVNNIICADEVEQRTPTNAELLDVNDVWSHRDKEIDELKKMLENEKKKNANVIERIAKSFKDERYNYEMEIEEMKKKLSVIDKEDEGATTRTSEETIEDIKAQMIVAHRECIADLTKSLDEANMLLEEKNADNIYLAEQLELSKAENDKLLGKNDKLLDVVDSNTAENESKVEKLKSSLQGAIERNETLQGRVEKVSFENDKLLEKNINSLDIIESLRKSLNDERSSHKARVIEMKLIIEKEKEDKATIVEKNVDLSEKIQLSKNKIDGLEAEVQGLVNFTEQLQVSKAQLTAEQESLEESIADLVKSLDAAKKSHDDAMGDIQGKKILLEEKTAENFDLSKQIQLSKDKIDGLEAEVQALVDLAEQLQLSKVDSDGLKSIIQDLELKNSKDASNIANLVTSLNDVMTSLQDANARNEVLQIQVQDIGAAYDTLNEINLSNEGKNAELSNVIECMTIQFNNDKSSYKREVEEIRKMLVLEKENNAAIVRKSKKTLKYVTSQMADKLSTQKEYLSKTISDLVKSCDSAAVDVNNKRTLLEEKAAENDSLVKQLQLYMTKNDGLKSEVQTLITRNTENIQQMNVLEGDVAAKQSIIDQIRIETNEWAATCDNMVAENALLEDRLDVYKDESDGLKKTVQEMESKNKENAIEVENLTSSLQEVIERNEASHEKELEELRKMLAMEKVEKAVVIRKSKRTLGYVTAQMTAEISTQKESIGGTITLLSKALDESKKSLDEALVDVHNKKILLEAKSAQITGFDERLKLSNNKNQELEKEVQTLVNSNTVKALQMTVMEDDLTAKTIMMDEMSIDFSEQKLICDETMAENAALKNKLEVFTSDIENLKATIQNHEARNTNYANEIENLMISLNEFDRVEVINQYEELQVQIKEFSSANEKLVEINNASEEKIIELLDAVESLTKSLNNERSNHEKELKEMKTMLEEEKHEKAAIARKSKKALGYVTAQMADKMSAQKDSLEGNIDDVGKSLNEAMQLLEDKTAENVNLNERLQRYISTINSLRSEVHTLVASNKEKNDQITMLEDDTGEKKIMIDKMLMNINTWKTACEEMAIDKAVIDEERQLFMSENETLNHRLELFKAENDGLKQTLQDLESKNTSYKRKIDDLRIKLAKKKENHSFVVKKLESNLKDVKAQMIAQMSAMRGVAAENAELIEQLDDINAVCAGLKIEIMMSSQKMSQGGISDHPRLEEFMDAKTKLVKVRQQLRDSRSQDPVLADIVSHFQLLNKDCE